MVDYKTWMKEVDDDVKLSKLSIPGTHNAAACHTALPSVQCQGKSVTDQLKHGVRFLDIRVAKQFLKSGDDANDLQVIHGNFPVRIPFPLKFKSVLEEVFDFLDDNKSETVIVSIKQEGPDKWDNDNDEFANVIWDKYVDKQKDKWYLKTDLPKLGDARGKAILFRRFGVNNEDRKKEFGFDAASWSYNTTEDDRGTFCVQDFCEIQEESDIEKKVGYVKDLAKKAKDYNSSSSDPKLFINFCSGANFFNHDCWPQKVAERVTKNNIQDCFEKGVGVIVLDYVDSDDWKLVKELVDKNF
ncbi:Piso0_001069 [Millerozyma farinosa CBS 7064]|uniref:Piso0_001069 protein n=1 Tax=Pichia sorbitophila (strain ATCC MYA-4447 / BCRC 22081 / CBS 7064 / NBRC 10061 / NRRL Y-12695) TaxID=559304 RepID=G8YSA9_PICSO|nr:Piso0_001069 [Millerozyma farinosa CBS 7064]CCE79032.1 Piso0_001069 [Millerozyma farinosa CBS 7064]